MATAKQRAAKRPYKKTTRKPRVKAAAASPKKTAKTTGSIDAATKVAATEAPDGRLRRLPTAWAIGQKSVRILLSNKLLFGGILLIYILMSLLVIRAFSNNLNVSGLKNLLKGNFSGSFSGIWAGLSIYTVLIASSNSSTSGLTVTYQVLLGLIISLATIWGIRQVREAKTAKIRIRDSFYLGMYPLIPVILVLMVVLLELIPFIIGAYIYGVVIGTGVAVHVYEKAIWVLVLTLGVFGTGYLLTSSVFAIYIATLPGMEPIKALRSARQLVKGRRWPLIRKLLALPLGLFVASSVIMVPIILVISSAAPFVFFIISLISLVLIHAYMYTLYRELL